jgi:hypothetical protein
MMMVSGCSYHDAAADDDNDYCGSEDDGNSWSKLIIEHNDQYIYCIILTVIDIYIKAFLLMIMRVYFIKKFYFSEKQYIILICSCWLFLFYNTAT